MGEIHTQSRFEEIMEREKLLPVWQLAEQAFPQLQEQARIEAVQFLGGVAIRGESEIASIVESNNSSSLMAAAQEAALGDASGEAVVRKNAATDVAERLYKAGHQTEVEMEAVDGYFQQDGRRMVDLQRNTFEHTKLNGEMLRRGKYELRNLMLFQRMHAAGVFDTHDALVLSTASTTMSQDEKKEYGMFVNTDTCSVQLLSADGSNVTLQTALVAGKKTPDSERHDIAAIQAMAEAHGLNIQTEDGTEMVRQVILLPKGYVEGVHDVVQWYDDAAGGTFYGQAKPRQDYAAFAALCKQRNFDDMVDEITERMIASAHEFETPMDAILKLDELSEEVCVERAVVDSSINAAVFGEKAKVHIEEARFFIERGDMGRAEQSMNRAKETADSSSCPINKSKITGESMGGDETMANGGEEEASKKEWGKCPYCRSLVYVDPCAKKISCWDCTAAVVNGRVISTGNGGRAKRQQEAKARLEKQEAARQKVQAAGSLAVAT
jgi:hypothetical protein